MDYPDWAPKSLVNLLATRRSKDPRNMEAKLAEAFDFDIESQVESLIEEFALDAAAKEKVRNRLWRSRIFLPTKESNAILEKLISNPQMKSVWTALEKRGKNDRFAIELWQFCDIALCRWRGESKLSPNERRDLLVKIVNTAEDLSSLLQQSREFDRYWVHDMIQDDQIASLIGAGGLWKSAKENIDFARFNLAEIIPSIHTILIDIQNKAASHLKDEPLVRKPQSKNAEIHYFARSLSGHFQLKYGQPLHDAVALTTCTIFDRDDIDADNVRKLVSGLPGN